MDPELDKAFLTAIRKYFKDEDYDKMPSVKDKKYNKKYFDSAAEELLPAEEDKKVKKEVKNAR